MKTMKNIILILLAASFFACSEELDVKNPNEPTLDVLEGEEGIRRLMLGMYNVEDAGYVWIAQAHHEVMGDALFVPWGNFSWRWANQPTSITLDDGTVVTPPEGGTQGEMLQLFNNRAQGDNNAFAWEWSYMYRYINVANLLLEQVETTSFETDGEQKQAIIKAFAYYWRGFAYSRIGSMYSAGLITNTSGETNGNFLANDAIIEEANRNFDLAVDEFNKISNTEVYNAWFGSAIPDFMRPNGIPSPNEMVADINTYKARNLLVNTKLDDMTDADWNTILSLTGSGLQNGDLNLEWRTANENSLFFTAWNPYRVLIGWAFVSPRLIQDFKEGDMRFSRNFANVGVTANLRGRGIQYGNEHDFIPIESGGDYASLEEGAATLAVGTTWEENALMRAEALIMTNEIESGLALIDEVRASQNSGLDPVAGTGLTMEQAYEELRRERRIGLLLRGLAFYDARRWGITDPVSEGGGRTGCVVFDANGVKNTNATFDYNYLDYWGVPDDELDFNPALEGSASTDPQ